MIESFMDLSMGIHVALALTAVIALIAQLALYAKANQPPVSCVVPGWNVVSFMRIVGRPDIHSLFILVPMAAVVGVFFGFYESLTDYYVMGNIEFSEVMIPHIIMGVAGLVMGGFMMIVYKELCESFGKTSTMDYVMCILFNGFYVLNLGISYTIEYQGPVYGKSKNQSIEEEAVA